MNADSTLSVGLAQHNRMTKPLNWFEIPALDIDRARVFYEKLLSITFQTGSIGPANMAVFPYDRAAATGGCLMSSPGFQPSKEGSVVYLNVEDSVDAALARAVDAGGAVLLNKTALPPGMGFYAHIADTEGNRVGLHGLQ